MHTTTPTVLQMVLDRMNLITEQIVNLQKAADSDSGGWVAEGGYADALINEQKFLHSVMKYIVDNEVMPELEGDPGLTEAAELATLTELAAELPVPQTTSTAEPVRSEPSPPIHSSPAGPRTWRERLASRMNWPVF